jgi:hypothetical protein
MAARRRVSARSPVAAPARAKDVALISQDALSLVREIEPRVGDLPALADPARGARARSGGRLSALLGAHVLEEAVVVAPAGRARAQVRGEFGEA